MRSENNLLYFIFIPMRNLDLNYARSSETHLSHKMRPHCAWICFIAELKFCGQRTLLVDISDSSWFFSVIPVCMLPRPWKSSSVSLSIQHNLCIRNIVDSATWRPWARKTYYVYPSRFVFISPNSNAWQRGVGWHKARHGHVKVTPMTIPITKEYLAAKRLIIWEAGNEII